MNCVAQSCTNHAQCCSAATSTDQQNHSHQLSADKESKVETGKLDATLFADAADASASGQSTLSPRPTCQEVDLTSCSDHSNGVLRESGIVDSGIVSPPATCSINSRETDTGSSSSEQNTPPDKQHQHRSPVIMREMLLHVPEMNLPWTPLRGVTQCECGVTFSFTKRKVWVTWLYSVSSVWSHDCMQSVLLSHMTVCSHFQIRYVCLILFSLIPRPKGPDFHCLHMHMNYPDCLRCRNGEGAKWHFGTHLVDYVTHLYMIYSNSCSLSNHSLVHVYCFEH